HLHWHGTVRLAGEGGAQDIPPVFVFLPERPEFPEARGAAGTAFIGPPADAMRAMGSKLESRALAASHGVPVTPGSEALDDPAEAARMARAVGYPVIVKPSGGGGGIGMKVVEKEEDLGPAIESSPNAAPPAFR